MLSLVALILSFCVLHCAWCKVCAVSREDGSREMCWGGGGGDGRRPENATAASDVLLLCCMARRLHGRWRSYRSTHINRAVYSSISATTTNKRDTVQPLLQRIEMESLDPQLRALLEQHKQHFSLENGKIKCHLNGHAFPARLDAVAPFIR